MNAIVSLRLTEIDIPEPLLAYHGFRTVEIAKAIRAGGELAADIIEEQASAA